MLVSGRRRSKLKDVRTLKLFQFLIHETRNFSNPNPGGRAGRAVAGSNYSITAESVTSAFKGLK
jgi:hypothetical protein